VNVRRGNWTEHPLLARRDDPAVVRVSLLEGIGVPRRSISRRCEPGGPWRRLLPGIVLLGDSEPTREHRVRAALLHGRDGAMVTGLWALRGYGLTDLPELGDVRVLVPAERAVASTGFVTVERTTRLPEPQIKREIALAPAHRAVVDAVRRLSGYEAVLGIMAEAVRLGRCTVRALTGELDLCSRRGTALARRALLPLTAEVHSVATAEAWLLWEKTGLPACRWNVELHDSAGQRIATADAWFDEVAMAWEIGSPETRDGGDNGGDFTTAITRKQRYAATGIVVLRTSRARLRTEPGTVLAEIRAAYEIASGRSRPDVRFG
jgi:hypothetical protein